MQEILSPRFTDDFLPGKHNLLTIDQILPLVCNVRTIFHVWSDRKGFKIPTFKIPMFKIPMNQNTNRPYQNTNRPYQNTNGPYQNTNKHYQNTNNAFSKYQQRKFIIPTLKFIISKYQQPYQNTNRPYDHVQNTNTSNSPFQNGRPYPHHNLVRIRYCPHHMWCGLDIVRTTA